MRSCWVRAVALAVAVCCCRARHKQMPNCAGHSACWVPNPGHGNTNAGGRSVNVRLPVVRSVHGCMKDETRLTIARHNTTMLQQATNQMIEVPPALYYVTIMPRCIRFLKTACIRNCCRCCAPAVSAFDPWLLACCCCCSRPPTFSPTHATIHPAACCKPVPPGSPNPPFRPLTRCHNHRLPHFCRPPSLEWCPCPPPSLLLR